MNIVKEFFVTYNCQGMFNPNGKYGFYDGIDKKDVYLEGTVEENYGVPFDLLTSEQFNEIYEDMARFFFELHGIEIEPEEEIKE